MTDDINPTAPSASIDRDAIHKRLNVAYDITASPQSRQKAAGRLIDDAAALLVELAAVEGVLKDKDDYIERANRQLQEQAEQLAVQASATNVQTDRADRAEDNLARLAARLLRMADAWEANLPDTIRTAAAANAVRAEVEAYTS